MVLHLYGSPVYNKGKLKKIDGVPVTGKPVGSRTELREGGTAKLGKI